MCTLILKKSIRILIILCFDCDRVVVEPARGQARGSHRDRYSDNDRYSSRRGGGRYANDK